MIFKCKNCGGNAVYEPGKNKMYCPHCESIDSESMVPDNSMTECVNCGAPIKVGEFTSASRCAHCGCYLVFDERVSGQYEPHLILPFKVNKDMAVEALNKEFKHRTFTPAGFLSQKSLEGMQGIYVPFWLYDYQAQYDFTGTGTKVRRWTSGDTEYTETSYYEIERHMHAGFDKVPADASLAMEDGEMDLMEPYAYGDLQDFQPKYMSGFFGEVYNQSAEELEVRAKDKVKEASEKLLQNSITGYQSVITRNKNLDLRNDGTNYALLPVWMYLYRYKDKTYRFHVNGQTGKVVGKTPVSKEKVVAYGLSVMVYVSAIVSLAMTLLEVL